MALTDADRLQMTMLALQRWNNLGHSYKYYLDEGDSFPATERGIIELFRSNGYEVKSIPINTGAGNVACRFNSTRLQYYDGLIQNTHWSLINDPTLPSLRTRTYAGNNNIIFSSPAIINQWMRVMLAYGGFTASQKVSNFSLLFDDSVMQDIETAIINGYLSPLCMVGSFDGYGFDQWRGITNGTTTEIASYPITEIYIKPIKRNIIGVNYDAAVDGYWDEEGIMDGISAILFEPKIQFSLSPMYDFDTIKIDFKRI